MPVIADIIDRAVFPETGVEIMTARATYPTHSHKDVMAHKFFSRSASSGRAIPVSRMLQIVRDNPALPIFWGRNQKGMAATEELSPLEISLARAEIMNLMEHALRTVDKLKEIGLHKQNANTYLEPWMHTTTVITSVHWNQFNLLRDHPDARPELQAIAQAINAAKAKFPARELKHGEWYTPFVQEHELGESLDTRLKISTARCARTSYNLFDGIPSTVQKDLELYQKLITSRPIHASPAEHQATPDRIIGTDSDGDPIWEKPKLHGNLTGFIQHRKMLPDEFIRW